MKLGEAIEISERLKNNGIKSLTISKDSMCGLYDPWNGAGGLLGINLEKDVVLPVEYIDSALLDGMRGHSAASIWGMNQEEWGEVVKIEEKPKTFKQRLDDKKKQAAELNANREKPDKPSKSRDEEL
jgi:hypothetical protein